MKPQTISLPRLTVLALFAVLALVIYYVESLIPPLIPIPGVKLGLANIITLILIKNTSLKETFLVLLTRILLAAILFGQAISLLYSLSGGLFCLLVMYLMNVFLQGHYTWIMGIFGALSHNLGQLLIAMLLTSSIAPMTYLPFFILCSLVTGLFTGLCAHFSHKQLQTMHLFS